METFEGSYKCLNGFEINVGRNDEEKNFELNIKHVDAEFIYGLYEKLIEMIR